MLEAENNPTPRAVREPTALTRWIISRRVLGPHMDGARIARRRRKAEAMRQRSGAPHVVDYYHQLDDPYSHLTAQVLATFAARYDIQLNVHLIRAAGGTFQPELEKLAIWARRDAAWVAPHLGLTFPATAGMVPAVAHQELVARALAGVSVSEFVAKLRDLSDALWTGDEAALQSLTVGRVSATEAAAALAAGSEHLAAAGHYSGATFYYAGEWYWGVDRLFHLELRLRDLGVCRTLDEALIAPRPEIDLAGVDASALRLDYYPSLNSPYTAINFDATIALKNICGIEFHHKPVLPMVMRGVPAPRTKTQYLVFDTKREADFAGVPFGNALFPIGRPTREAYSLLPWAQALGKDEALMSSLLRHAFALGVGLHRRSGMRRAVEAAGLDWAAAQRVLGSDDWKPIVEQS
ncbi:MAG: 2-hydroxychromene-2-carboxylate isomerase [Pseudomonadota bacterium]